ncbi:MAG TPA: HAD family phosphatase [Bryobacteraceae bacterium]|jgi:putative hydrolase of the HAD superfamily|nr:HAD family phosphatase [Bryobacteraceae bacterium]
MIKAILFDLGNVIVPFDFKRAYAKLGPLCACPVSEITSRLRSSDLIQRFETGRIDSQPFVSELSTLLGLKTNYDEFCDLWTSVFFEETLVPESLITRLRDRHRLLALSNTNPIHFSMLKARYPLLGHFDDFVLSYQVGALKPDAKIYQEAVRRARCLAEECFFTDDIAINVEAARTNGMDAVQFLSVEQLEEELRARRVL